MRARLLPAVLGMATIVCSCQSSMARHSPKSADVTFCNFKIAEAIKRANYTSLIIYQFTLDKDGVPRNVRKLKDEFVGEAAVARCLALWQFSGFTSGEVLHVVFIWEHAKGWTQMSVGGQDYHLIVKVSGERAPYGAVRAPATERRRDLGISMRAHEYATAGGPRR